MTFQERQRRQLTELFPCPTGRPPPLNPVMFLNLADKCVLGYMSALVYVERGASLLIDIKYVRIIRTFPAVIPRYSCLLAI